MNQMLTYLSFARVLHLTVQIFKLGFHLVLFFIEPARKFSFFAT